MLEVNTSTPLNALVSRILGDFAFMIVGDELSETPGAPEWLFAKVTYRGPMQGTIHCWCTRPFATELTSNLLGLDPESPEVSAELCDSVRELMNILCGNLVTERFGAEAVFDLSIPEVEETLAGPELQGAPEHDLCRLEVSDAPIIVEHFSTN